MALPIPPPEVARAGLRALKTVALADGELHALELELIEAVRRHVLQSDLDLAALETIAPSELARAVPDGAFRARIVSGCCLLTLIDGAVKDRERAVVGAFAKALGVKDRTLKTLEHYAEGHALRLRFDVARRFLGVERGKKEIRDKGLLAVFRMLRDLLLKRENAALANQYRALGELGPETLGRQYVEFMRTNGFSLPGEVGAAPEPICFHDATHVLAGYGTTPDEEAQIAAFHAGTNGEDMFGMLLFAVMQFQLGVQITPATVGHQGFVKPDLLARAFMRGTQVKGQMTRDWDPRPHWTEPVSALRAELRIAPRVGVSGQPRPGPSSMAGSLSGARNRS